MNTENIEVKSKKLDYF